MYEQLLRDNAATCNTAAAEQKDPFNVRVLTQNN